MAQIVREGIISEVFPEKHSARVTFPDRGNLVSAEMPILTLAAGANKTYFLPSVGERTICLMAGNSANSGAGYIIGSLYTGENKPEENNLNNYSLKFSDEAKISYQRKTESDKHSELKITLADGAEISYSNEDKNFEFHFKFSDGAEISYNSDAEFKMSFKDKSTIEHDGQRGDLDLNIKGEINITSQGEINIESRSDVNIQGAAIHLN